MDGEEGGQSGKHQRSRPHWCDNVLWNEEYFQLNSAPERNKIINEITRDHKSIFSS